MKPEHFLYKSDGLYYMQNVPVIPFALESCDCPGCKYAKMAYNESLKRAKVEAVKVDDETLINYFLDQYNRCITSRLPYTFEGKLGYIGRLIEGEIYTINMEEKIEVVEIPCGGAACPSRWGQSCIHSKLIARMAAPKKEDETRSTIWNEWLSKVVDGEGYIIPTKFREAQKHFEIKRRPL